MAANDVVQLAVQGVVGGQQHVHTLHFRFLTAAPTPATLIADYQTTALPEYRAMFITTDQPAQLITATVVCSSGPFSAPAQAAPPAPAGLRTAPVGGPELLPTFVAEVVSWRTALAGRSRRGRSFFGGLCEFDVIANTLPTTAGTRYPLTTAYADEIISVYGAAASGTLYRAVVWSGKLHTLPGATCLTASEILTGYVHPTAPATMRSRKLGSGS